ncbi:hypothetical protein Q9R23_07385 [Exiguobacterium sp. BRG2]|uniref:hypothetical protein n=1 Tax=Exiguobacterium sp. BRG2 TaxID=2962584 RepID=UPI0028828636|nr:hypothetical protein [Exiguobacterium sp. BRG2]MDT0172790.1 hypothetical protein [Exiguobacterium sp. BRG2]
MQKWIKSSLICLMAIVLLGSGTVSAATKAETLATSQYKGLKNGMTMQQVAQVLYGKSYQKHFKKRNGSTVLKLPINFEGDEEGHKQLIHVLSDSTTTHPPTELVLQFMTKQKSTKYRLVTKGLFIERKTKTGYRESTRLLVKGATLQNGMTEKEMDAKLTGKGLGNWTMLGHMDTASAYTLDEQKRGFAEVSRIKEYVFKSTTNKWKHVKLTYNEQAKTYEISDMRTIKTKN